VTRMRHRRGKLPLVMTDKTIGLLWPRPASMYTAKTEGWH